MRSLGFTLILGLLALAVTAVASWQWIEGNFDSVLGAPATPVGQRIYSGFTPADVKSMRISQNGTTATFELGPDGWRSTSPWEDRMDPRAAVGIVNFTLGLRVEDIAEADKVDAQKAGLRDSGINIRLENGNRQVLAKYKLGRQTPWLATVKDVDQPVPTVFVRPRDEDHKNYIYACTGDITPLFKENLKFLRDHHPFYFNPLALREIRIRSQQGELTLHRPVSEWITSPDFLSEVRNRFFLADTDRDGLVSQLEWLAMKGYDPQEAVKQRKFSSADSDKNQQLTPDEFTGAFLGAWRIAKPLDLPTDPRAMKTLLEGLFELKATKLSDRASVTVPTTAPGTSPQQIAITPFGSTTETVLEIIPTDAESTEVLATVSDRPGTVFTLPSKPDEANVSLAELPLAVNELRDSTLTHLNIKSLRGIEIIPNEGYPIRITRNPPHPWMASIEGRSQEANEERLFSLLKAVTDGKATSFVTDAATDFTPWGLDKPTLTLRFLGEPSTEPIELRFGSDGQGNYFVNRSGTPTVMGIDQGLLSSVPVKAFEWRPSRLWSIDRVNLLAIRRQSADEPPLTLLYDFTSDTWTADLQGANATSRLDPTRAAYLLGILEGLKVTRWLSPTDQAAEKALLTPSLQVLVIENQTDNMGDAIGRITRGVTLAPATPGANPIFYYGRLSSDEQPFMLDRETYIKLATRVIEAE